MYKHDKSPTIPHSVARLTIVESGYLDFRSLCAAARVSRELKRMAYFECSIGRTLDLSNFGGDKLTDGAFRKLYTTRIRFKGQRRVRNVSVQGCPRLSAKALADFVSHFNTNPLTLTENTSTDIDNMTEARFEDRGTDNVQNDEEWKSSTTRESHALLPKYTTSSHGNGMRIFMWQAGAKGDWDVQRVLYRCCDIWCSVRANRQRSVQLQTELFLWIRSEDVLRSITSRELTFVLQALEDHQDYEQLHSHLLKVCQTRKSPQNIVPEKICQLEDSAIYIGTICPGNCCLQVMAKQAPKPPNKVSKAVRNGSTRRANSVPAVESVTQQSDHSQSGSPGAHHGRSSSAPNSRYVWRTDGN